MAAAAATKALGNEILEGAAAAVRKKGVDRVSKHFMDGNVVEEILTAIRNESPDLVVCGARGLSSFTHLILGSVSTKITQRCPVTRVTVHTPAE
ncbi:hypothetical protein GFM13_11490 [Rhizobium leguminosarum bv. viciae]|nr:hypothetical protein [Rhizobium leguminosarum bv. viciae]